MPDGDIIYNTDGTFTDSNGLTYTAAQMDAYYGGNYYSTIPSGSGSTCLNRSATW